MLRYVMLSRPQTRDLWVVAPPPGAHWPWGQEQAAVEGCRVVLGCCNCNCNCDCDCHCNFYYDCKCSSDCDGDCDCDCDFDYNCNCNC